MDTWTDKEGFRVNTIENENNGVIRKRATELSICPRIDQYRDQVLADLNHIEAESRRRVVSSLTTNVHRLRRLRTSLQHYRSQRDHGRAKI